MAWLKYALAFDIILNKRKTDVSGNYSSVHISNICVKIKTWNKSIYGRLRSKKINVDNFCKFCQEFCRFSMGISFLNWVSCFAKPGWTRPTSFSNFKPFIQKSNFLWNWKSLEWWFSHILSNHFSSLSSCQTAGFRKNF